MQPVNTFPRIITDETMRETVSHGSAAYPFEYYLENVWDFDLHSIDWHWHPELEFMLVKTGEVHCYVGGEKRTVYAGQGMFVNTRAMHRFTADADAMMPNIVFSPVLLANEESPVYQRYVRPVLENGAPFAVFAPAVDWQARIIALLDEVFSAQEQDDVNELKTVRLLMELWDVLQSHIDHTEEGAASARSDGNRARLQIMMQYIHDHYREEITLDDIAAAAFISKSSALQIFRDGIRQTPVNYLNRCRLTRAAQALRATEKSIAAIAEENGFQSAGYFCRRFRKLFSESPGEYRKEKRERPR